MVIFFFFFWQSPYSFFFFFFVSAYVPERQVQNSSTQSPVATLDDSAGSWVDLKPLVLRLPGLAGRLLSSGPF